MIYDNAKSSSKYRQMLEYNTIMIYIVIVISNHHNGTVTTSTTNVNALTALGSDLPITLLKARNSQKKYR